VKVSGIPLPINVALARAVEHIPAPGTLPGGCLYEPKWDGFRCILSCDEVGMRLWSRHGTDLTSTFPEVAAAAAAQVEPGTVLDGELVVWSRGLDFDAL
jgi:ATP-dependent DNA ligase